jgi:hypothetical protein
MFDRPGNCEYAAGDWEVQYCLQNSTTCLPGNAPPAFFATVYGAADPAAVLRGTGVLLAPFEFVPGAKYHYRSGQGHGGRKPVLCTRWHGCHLCAAPSCFVETA